MCNYLSFCLSGVSFRSLQSVGWGILGVGAGEWGGGLGKGRKWKFLDGGKQREIQKEEPKLLLDLHSESSEISEETFEQTKFCIRAKRQAHSSEVVNPYALVTSQVMKFQVTSTT